MSLDQQSLGTIAMSPLAATGETPGYHGRYLRIDLTTRTAEGVAIPAVVLRVHRRQRAGDVAAAAGDAGECDGGGGGGPDPVGVAAKRGERGGGPLAADRPIVIAFSPLVGTPLTTSAKFALLRIAAHGADQ